jgi:hypothetical protein
MDNRQPDRRSPDPRTKVQRHGLRSLATTIPHVAGPILGKQGFGFAQIITDWSSIVGSEMARHTVPEKLSFPKGARRDGTMRLRVTSAFAPDVQHLQPQILERVNGFFGYPAVARLQILQGPVPERIPVHPPRPKALQPAEQADLAESLAAITDPDLKAALDRLGHAVLGQPRKDE